MPNTESVAAEQTFLRNQESPEPVYISHEFSLFPKRTYNKITSRFGKIFANNTYKSIELTYRQFRHLCCLLRGSIRPSFIRIKPDVFNKLSKFFTNFEYIKTISEFKAEYLREILKYDGLKQNLDDLSFDITRLSEESEVNQEDMCQRVNDFFHNLKEIRSLLNNSKERKCFKEKRFMAEMEDLVRTMIHRVPWGEIEKHLVRMAAAFIREYTDT